MGADLPNPYTMFTREKEIISSIVDQGSSRATYGLIEYGRNSANVLQRLSQFINDDNFKQSVRSTSLRSAGRSLVPAMEKASEEFKTSTAKRKILVLFANALPSYNDLLTTARRLNKEGIKVVVLFYGTTGRLQLLENIVSNKDDLFPWRFSEQPDVIASELALQLFKGMEHT